MASECVGWCFVFFFQAEDGIRDKLVTGVQTCALPIWSLPWLCGPDWLTGLSERRLRGTAQQEIELGFGSLPLLLQHRQLILKLRTLHRGFQHIHLCSLPGPKPRIGDLKELFQKRDLPVVHLDGLMREEDLVISALHL